MFLFTVLVENNIYIYIYYPHDVCAIENAVAILPLIYKKWSQENLKGKKPKPTTWKSMFGPQLFLIICFKKASKLKKVHNSDEIHI